MTQELYERHRGTLEQALSAIGARTYWSAYSESPKAYDHEAAKAAFDRYATGEFPLDQPGSDGTVEAAPSPYGISLRTIYPRASVDALVEAAEAARPGWRDAGAEARAGVCLEILHRLNERSGELALAVMHTTGQPFVMALQAGGPHAQDRGLEALAYSFAELTRHATNSRWEKPAGRDTVLVLEKTFRTVPRGVGLVIGCTTFPTWNSYPGLFASLATGNPVIVKPHHACVLPLALTVQIAREVLAEAGHDPNVVTLAVGRAEDRLSTSLATRPEVRVIDFTGSTANGEWLEANARQAQVYTEKAGVNSVVIDSTESFSGMCRNLALSLSLYSGQMCTTPQNLLVRREGIQTDEGHKSFEEVALGIGGAIEKLLGDPERAVEVTGAIVNEGVLETVERAPSLGQVVLESRSLEHPRFPHAIVRTPALIRVDAADEEVYGQEHFGPVSFLIATASTEESVEIFRRTGIEHGAITAAVYSTSEDVLAAAEEAAMEVGVALSCNLTGGVFVNQSAAFSDFHATGANPAANACLTDAAFVAGRFRIVQSRRPVAAA